MRVSTLTCGAHFQLETSLGMRGHGIGRLNGRHGFAETLCRYRTNDALSRQVCHKFMEGNPIRFKITPFKA